MEQSGGGGEGIQTGGSEKAYWHFKYWDNAWKSWQGEIW